MLALPSTAKKAAACDCSEDPELAISQCPRVALNTPLWAALSGRARQTRKRGCTENFTNHASDIWPVQHGHSAQLHRQEDTAHQLVEQVTAAGSSVLMGVQLFSRL